MTASNAARPHPETDWLTVNQACALIGVSAATLRRWSDAGAVSVFTTPGGHRRFQRSAILGLVAATRRSRPSLDSLGETPDHMADVCRATVSAMAQRSSWPRELREGDAEPYRRAGDRLATAVLRFVDAASPVGQDEALRVATDAAAEYGRLAAVGSVGLQRAIEIFLEMREGFTSELTAMAREQGLTTREATDVLERAADALDRSLVGLVDGYNRALAERASADGSLA